MCVWDIRDCSSRIVLKGALEKGIVNICFSPDGKRLAASSLDEEHNIVVYDIAAQIKARENPTKSLEKVGLIAAGKGAKAEIMDLKFTLDGKSLIAACNKEFYFIEIEEGRGLLKAKKALFGKVSPEPVMSIGFLNNAVVKIS
jgi:WD40 repeat protein